MMKRHIYFLLPALVAVLSWPLASCTDDLETVRQTVTVDDSDLVSARLSLGVAAMSTSPATTRADADDKQSDNVTQKELQGTEAERKIDNIWVFQFDASSGNLLDRKSVV